MRFLLSIVLLIVGASPAIAQAPTAPAQDVPVEMAVPKLTAFQSSLGNAIRSARKSKKMSARQAIKLRVALLSPAFRQQAEDLAVTQMAFSDASNELPRGSDGKVDRASIDWDGLAAFLERLLPILLQLVDMFASNQSINGAIA